MIFVPSHVWCPWIPSLWVVHNLTSVMVTPHTLFLLVAYGNPNCEIIISLKEPFNNQPISDCHNGGCPATQVFTKSHT